MKENNTYNIITENEKNFKKIKWLKVILILFLVKDNF